MIDLKKNYVISHGYAESGRLHLQQWLWKMQLGWELHLAIQLPTDGKINIADLGCGNCAWLLSLASELNEEQGKRAVMSGFDISSVHFPATDNLPENFHLKTMDAFSEIIPDAMIGRFDVVHVRVFVAVVKNNNPGPLITNALKMLKPGGYFQWDEMDGNTMKAIPPNPSVSIAATQEMLDTALLSSRNAMNLNYDWCSNLGAIFRQSGLEVIVDTRMQLKRELWKPMSDSALMMFEHVAKIAVKDGCMVGTDKNWAELWNKSGPEIDNSVAITMDMLVRVGRKST